MEENLKKMHEELGSLLDNMKKLDPTSDDYARCSEAANKIADRIIKLEEIRNNKSMEELRQDGKLAELENNLEVERLKQGISKSKMMLELVKTFGPPLISSGTFVWAHCQTGHFEETNRYVSALSRITNSNFPKIWK